MLEQAVNVSQEKFAASQVQLLLILVQILLGKLAILARLVVERVRLEE